MINVSFFISSHLTVFLDNWYFCYFFLLLLTNFLKIDALRVRKYHHESTLILFLHSDLFVDQIKCIGISVLYLELIPETNYGLVYWSQWWFPLGSTHRSLRLAHTNQLLEHSTESSVPFVVLSGSGS